MIDAKATDFSNTPVSARRPVFGYALEDLRATPLVTVVTPVLNPGLELHDTARSLFNQSFQQWEWILVNDGTTATTSNDILEAYRTRDPRIRIVDHPHNRGLSAARNTGVAHATTQFIALLDGDDMLEPTAIEKWLWFLSTHPEFGFCKGYSIGFGAECYLWERGFHDGAAFLVQNLVDVTSLIRRDVFGAAGQFDESNHAGLEDWEFWIRCASLGMWGGTVPEYLNWYRRRPLSQNPWPNLESGRLEGFRDRLRERYPELWGGAFPVPRSTRYVRLPAMAASFGGANRLQRTKQRLLFLEQELGDDAWNRDNLVMLARLVAEGWEVTVVATGTRASPSAAGYEGVTPDVFLMHSFVHPVYAPAWLDYLIASRRYDAICVSRSELGSRLLPRFRARGRDLLLFELMPSNSLTSAGVSAESGFVSDQSGTLPEFAANGEVDDPSSLLAALRAMTLPPMGRSICPRADVVPSDPGEAELACLIADAQWADVMWFDRDARRVAAAQAARIQELEAWTTHQQQALDRLQDEHAQLTKRLAGTTWRRKP